MKAELGFREADAAIAAARQCAAGVVDRMLAIDPHTLDGLRAKARVIRAMEYDPDERLIDDILAIPGDVA